jgi:uncharacterized protein YgbK (DUF1537 family)
MCILALVDDMTGALEVGAKFSAAGIDTVVWAKPAAPESMCAIVFDTETLWSAKTTLRHLSPCSRTVHKRFRMFGIPDGPNFCGAQVRP